MYFLFLYPFKDLNTNFQKMEDTWSNIGGMVVV
jgi:hypothetical protein